MLVPCTVTGISASAAMRVGRLALGPVTGAAVLDRELDCHDRCS